MGGTTFTSRSNSKSEQGQGNYQDKIKKCLRQGEFELSNVNFAHKGSSDGSLISEMSSEFVRSLIFQVFKLSRTNSVYEFPKLSLQLYVKSPNPSIPFFPLSHHQLWYKQRHLVKKCSISKSSRKQKWRKFHSLFTRGKL